MARGVEYRFQDLLKLVQSRKIAEMESFVAARSPQQLINLRGFFRPVRQLQTPKQSREDLTVPRSTLQHRRDLSTSAAYQPFSTGSTQAEQKRTVTTSPRVQQQMMYGSGSLDNAKSHIALGTALGVQDHLQHLAERRAQHELLYALELRQQQVRQSKVPNVAGILPNAQPRSVTRQTEVMPGQPSLQQPLTPEPRIHEGHVASLPQQAADAGVVLEATEEERRQSLLDLALADLAPVSSPRRVLLGFALHSTATSCSHDLLHPTDDAMLCAALAVAL